MRANEWKTPFLAVKMIEYNLRNDGKDINETQTQRSRRR